MKGKTLIFIPYQDSDNFYSDGILTREFAMLYLLYQQGYTEVINVKKPRTVLDKKRYKVNESYYPEGTIESKVKVILDNSNTVQQLPLLSIQQVLFKRGWWTKGYLNSFDDISTEINGERECLVYSNNPYASELLKELKKRQCKIYFDIMDNFAIHPSLSTSEKKIALEGYKSILKFADIVSANSQQTCEYMKKYCSKKILLVKNGVFLNNEIKDIGACDQISEIIEKKKKFSKTVGYIGKLGKRLDAQLIRDVSEACKNMLFVFVGPYLEDQLNGELMELFKQDNNVLHLEGIPSAFVYSMLDQFDILMIPHSVGKNENGGDPLKLYQYLTRNKPIITTPILGVDEFKDSIEIALDTNRWIEYVSSNIEVKNLCTTIDFDWLTRFKPVMRDLT